MERKLQKWVFPLPCGLLYAHKITFSEFFYGSQLGILCALDLSKLSTILPLDVGEIWWFLSISTLCFGLCVCMLVHIIFKILSSQNWSYWTSTTLFAVLYWWNPCNAHHFPSVYETYKHTLVHAMNLINFNCNLGFNGLCIMKFSYMLFIYNMLGL